MTNLRTKSPEEIDCLLMDPAGWIHLSGEDLSDLLNISMILYGIRRDQRAIPHLAYLYRQVVQTHDIKARTESYRVVLNEITNDRTTVVSLLPIVVCEPDPLVSSSAALDLIANSTLMDGGLPYGLMELNRLLRDRAPVNIGAVFGGVACFGDQVVRPTLEATKEYLTPKEVSTAAHCATGFLNVETLDFWLAWAEQLVSDTAAVSEMKLGHAAFALLNQMRSDRLGLVRKVKRHFKTEDNSPSVEMLKQWTIAEYALELAPRLYRLEQIETKPRIFPFVLQQFGLEPRSPRKEWANVSASESSP